MRVKGAIYPTSAATDFTREAWCQLVKSRPEFRRPAPVQKPNPFKRGQLMTIYPAPDYAQIIIEGRIPPGIVGG
jgi:hypothetical protein